MAVVMNPDGSAGLTVRADTGVSAPWLFQLAAAKAAFRGGPPVVPPSGSRRPR